MVIWRRLTFKIRGRQSRPLQKKGWTASRWSSVLLPVIRNVCHDLAIAEAALALKPIEH
jgi:hypothetical protein